MKESERSVNLGKAQEDFVEARKAAQAAQRALERAQELRDVTKARAEATERALRDATRAVLG